MRHLRRAAATCVALLLTAAAVAAPALADDASSVAHYGRSQVHSRHVAQASKYSYSQFLADLAGGRVATADFATISGRIAVKLRNGSRHALGYPLGAEPSLAARLAATGATVNFDNRGLNGGSGFDPTPMIAFGIVLLLAAVLAIL